MTLWFQEFINEATHTGAATRQRRDDRLPVRY